MTPLQQYLENIDMDKYKMMERVSICVILRENRNIILGDLADLAGIKPRRLGHIESGVSLPTYDEIEKLEKALGVKNEYKENK